MAGNFFDKFDDPKQAGNYFDKFDEGAPAPSIADRAKAGVAGISRGFWADLAGMPVDAAANAIDLGKAGIGYLTSKVTGKAPPDWTMPYDRSQVPGTSEWIAAQARKGANAVGVASPLDNPNPQDPVSSTLYNGGRVGGASVPINPNAALTAAKVAKHVVAGTAAGTAGATTDAFFPGWGGPVTMVTQAAPGSIPNAAKYVVRGGEAGRQAMAQRVQDLKNGGVDNPSLGLASGNQLIMGVENLLSKAPGSVGTYQDANRANWEGIKQQVLGARDLASSSYGTGAAGSAIQSDLQNGLKNKIQSNYRALNDKVGNIVGENYYVPVDNSIGTATALSTPAKGAPNTTAGLVNPRIAELAKNLKLDAYGEPLFGMNANAIRTSGGSNSAANTGQQEPSWTPVPGPYGNPIYVKGPALTPETTGNVSIDRSMPLIPLGYTSKQTAGATEPIGIPFGALKKIRTDIGQETQSNAIMGTPEQAQFKQLYGALTGDMRQGVNAADRDAAGVPIGPLLPEQQPGTAALNRANDYYSAGMGRVERVQPFVNKVAPEQAYTSLINALPGNLSTFQAVKKSVSPDTRGTIAATVLDDLGTAKASAQDNSGSVFSPETYLTNWNKLGPEGRREVFSGFPNADAVADSASDAAKATSMLRDSSKIWANPSGTAANVMAQGALGSIAGNLLTNPIAAVGGGLGLLGANQFSNKFLLNPDRIDWATSRPDPKVEQIQNQIQLQRALASMGVPGLLGN